MRPIIFRPRLKATLIHLTISLAVACFAAVVVFGVWYPFPYRDISGGRELFSLLVSVDVILGPLLTLVVFSEKKTRRGLFLDLSCIALLQVAALSYGLLTVASARPVHLVFEIDRFRVVHAIDVPSELLDKTPVGINARPWTGPTTLAIRGFKSQQESMDRTLAALQGLHLSFQPDLWQSYEAGLADVRKAAKPLALVVSRYPQYKNQFVRTAAGLGYRIDQISVLPLVGRSSFWTIFVNSENGKILTALPIDTFE